MDAAHNAQGLGLLHIRTGSLVRFLKVETIGSPTFLGNLHCAYALLFDPGGTNRIRPSRFVGVAPIKHHDKGFHVQSFFRGSITRP